MFEEVTPLATRVDNKETNKSTYNVIMVGAGNCFDINFNGALDVLGPRSRRVVIDKDPSRIRKVSDGSRIQADAFHLPISLYGKDAQNTIAVIGIPYHLPAIKELVSSGVRNLIVEKPMVNNTEELTELEGFLKQHPDLKLYPLDYYLQKAIPLGILTGKIGSFDPKLGLVIDQDNQPVSENYAGSFQNQIGQITGVDIELVEGGELGIPNLEKRPWLENDPIAGGMLLDLGTHAFVPLFYNGLLNAGELIVTTASRQMLDPDRKKLIPRVGDKPEIYAQVELATKIEGMDVKINFRVGKVPQTGRWSNTVIHGERGDILMGLRSGDPLIIKNSSGVTSQTRLKDGTNLYELALQEADQYFRGKSEVKDNYQAMRDSILLMDRIKSIS